MYEQSHRLSPLWLFASSSACHVLLIITADNAITYKSPAPALVQELAGAGAAITDMQMRQRDVAAPDAKNTRRS